MENLNKQVLAGAVACDICEEWGEMIKTADVHKLLDMYIKGIDFCLSNNFPSKDFLKENAGKLLADYGIYIDETLNLQNPLKAVLLGVCSGSLDVSDFTVSQIFLKHQTAAKINVSGNAFVVIDAFDDTVLNVLASGESKVLVNLYGRAELSQQTADNARIKVIRKLKETY